MPRKSSAINCLPNATRHHRRGALDKWLNLFDHRPDATGTSPAMMAQPIANGIAGT
jgi:hypothetical protein